MAAISNLYDPTQFQNLGSPTAPMANWVPQVAVAPMGNDRQLPDYGVQPGYQMGGWGLAPAGTVVPDAGSTWANFQKWMKDSGMLGSTDTATGLKTDGWGGLALGGASAIGNLMMGMKQYNLAKDQLSFSKEAFYKNFDAQRKSTNASLSDRQAARVASNPGAYQSVGDYMKQFGV